MISAHQSAHQQVESEVESEVGRAEPEAKPEILGLSGVGFTFDQDKPLIL
jgi:hypothetical protein